MSADVGSWAADYRALREGAGAYRLARDVLWVHGPDADGYLQGQCSQDVTALAPGAAADALLLAPDGKLDALVRVVRLGAGSFLLDVDGGFADPVGARLRRFKLRSKVAVDALDWSCTALRGAAVAGLVAGRPVSGLVPGGPLPDGTDGGAGDDGPDPGAPEVPGPIPFHWNGWSGVDLLGPPPGPEPPAGVSWCAEPAWEACRVESGVPVMGRELDGRTIAAEAGLVERTVSFTKGCFTGQELVARLDSRGNRVARRLCGVVLAAGSADDLATLSGATLLGAAADGSETERGRVTSSAWSPSLGAPVALAYLHRSVEVPGPVVVVRSDGVRRDGEARTLPLL